MKNFLFLIVFFLGACAPDEGSSTSQPFPTFNCETGEPDWVLAKAFSPDVVMPCNAGSTGICKAGYTYVSGTGWCKPDRAPLK